MSVWHQKNVIGNEPTSTVLGRYHYSRYAATWCDTSLIMIYHDLMMLSFFPFEARHMRNEYIAAAIRKVFPGVVELRSCVTEIV